MKKQRRKFVYLIAIIVIPIAAILLFWILAFTPLDLSQDYKDIPGIENIIFQPNGKQNQFYKRTFRGLKQTEAPTIPISAEDDEAVWEIDAFVDLTENTYICQAIISPDGNYILYCEIKYNYKGTGITDDEYCYYKVFNITTGEVLQIYGGYREWYNLGWL